MSKRKNRKVLAGVDVGGTKILSVVAEPGGTVLGRSRCSTPRDGSPEDVVEAIVESLDGALSKASAGEGDLLGAGVAIPGVVDPEAARVIHTPNMRIDGLDLGQALGGKLDAPVSVGNDANCGTLGEQWLGAARDARSAVGIFLGTGIGGGVVVEGSLLTGRSQQAGEVGHMIMQIDGPPCGCGGRGCYEAIASRTAIERDIRAAIAGGRESIVSDLLDEPTDRIRSGMLREALDAGDAVVTEVLTHAARVTGLACLSIRHLLDPEVIVLGGGVMEACGGHLLPIVREVFAADPLGGVGAGTDLLLSTLGDDAVALGAVALALRSAGKSPLSGPTGQAEHIPEVKVDDGEVRVGKKSYDADMYVRVDGKVKKWKKGRPGATVSTDLLKKVCKGGPAELLIGMDGATPSMDNEADAFLRDRGIAWRADSLDEAVRAFNDSPRRKALLLLIGDGDRR